MANRFEWERYNSLKNTINDAISDAMFDADEEDPKQFTIFISEDLENAVCFLDVDEMTLSALKENYSGWYVEKASSYEEAIATADSYFDLR